MKQSLLVLLAITACSFSFAQSFDGYALYNNANSPNAYLIDAEGDIAHTWNCPTNANYALDLTAEGNLVRGAIYSGNQINGAAVGGMVQELDPNGDVVWEFIYSNSTVVSHHDICLMPNGNVLLIAWEYVSNADISDIGYDGNDAKWATHIIEVAQNGTGGEIVWEWHIVDHFVQDEDSELPNYGVISENPQLLDINVDIDSSGPPGGGGANEWFHVNGIDYNEDLDQIAFTSRFVSELFVIDHSTTTEEAASHEGGNSGMGGDFIYRWGHPDNYDTDGAQIIPAAVHDVRWVKEGRPNAGYLQFFNNEGNNGGSTIDAIETPVNGFNYDISPGSAYAPATYSWRHECIDDASGQSASDRMSNGNVFVNLSPGQGGGGFMYEADMDGNVVFQYANGSNKAFRYECDFPGLQFILDNPCDTPDNIEEIDELTFSVYPNPCNTEINIESFEVQTDDAKVIIHNLLGEQVLLSNELTKINTSLIPSGIYYISLVSGSQVKSKKISILH